MQLKPKMGAQFKQTMEAEILPVLKRQQGFHDELVLMSADGREAIGISLWDSQQHAEAYSQQSYGEIKQKLSNVTESAPTVKTYDVSLTSVQRQTAKGGTTS
jgi:heme-degrading monooxygenase HmoA